MCETSMQQVLTVACVLTVWHEDGHCDWSCSKDDAYADAGQVCGLGRTRKERIPYRSLKHLFIARSRESACQRRVR